MAATNMLPGTARAKLERRDGVSRRRKHFHIYYSSDGMAFEKAHGVDISITGICALSEQPMPPQPKIRMHLEGYEFIVDMKVEWTAPQEHEGKTWVRTGLSFVNRGGQKLLIEAVVAGKPYKKEEALKAALEVVRKNPLRAAEALPEPLIKSFLTKLVGVKRLAGETLDNPLVKYEYKGAYKLKDGANGHRMVIFSRVSTNEGTATYTTSFIFDEVGERVYMIQN